MYDKYFLSFKPFGMLTLSSLKNTCETYSRIHFLYLAAIKESLHIDYDAVWKEAEEILTVEKLKPDDRKLKSKRGTKICKGKGKSELPDTELSKNRTCEEVPVTEQPNEYA
jgi:hypothetical protein